jgi:hypothetical protein
MMLTEDLFQVRSFLKIQHLKRAKLQNIDIPSSKPISFQKKIAVTFLTLLFYPLVILFTIISALYYRFCGYKNIGGDASEGKMRPLKKKN